MFIYLFNKFNKLQILSAKEDRCVITGKILFRNLYEKDQDAIDVVRNTDGDGRLEVKLSFFIIFFMAAF